MESAEILNLVYDSLPGFLGGQTGFIIYAVIKKLNIWKTLLQINLWYFPILLLGIGADYLGTPFPLLYFALLIIFVVSMLIYGWRSKKAKINSEQ